MLKSTYKTVRELSEGIYKEKGSKFIAFAVACYSEEEAKRYLDDWRKAHHQARHVCYAYRFGVDQSVFRANDDGEPNNSAGIPILGQIQSFDLSNVLIGVVRYFGGTKLGVGGLITAYKSAAKEAIEAANIIELEVFEWMKLEFLYQDLPGIMHIIKQNQLQTKDQMFELQCELTIAIPLVKRDLIKETFRDYSSLKTTILGIY